MITLDCLAQGIGGIVGETFMEVPFPKTKSLMRATEASIPRVRRPPPKTNRLNFSMAYQQNLTCPQDIPPFVPSEAGNKRRPDGVSGSKQRDPGRR
jgi:hypothetical protein